MRPEPRSRHRVPVNNSFVKQLRAGDPRIDEFMDELHRLFPDEDEARAMTRCALTVMLDGLSPEEVNEHLLLVTAVLDQHSSWRPPPGDPRRTRQGGRS